MYHLEISAFLYQHYVRQKALDLKRFWWEMPPIKASGNIKSVIIERLNPDREMNHALH